MEGAAGDNQQQQQAPQQNILPPMKVIKVSVKDRVGLKRNNADLKKVRGEIAKLSDKKQAQKEQLRERKLAAEEDPDNNKKLALVQKATEKLQNSKDELEKMEKEKHRMEASGYRKKALRSADMLLSD